MVHKMWVNFAKRNRTGEGFSDWNLFWFSFILILMLYMEAVGQFPYFYTMLCLKFHSFHEIFNRINCRMGLITVWTFLCHVQTLQKAGRWLKLLGALKSWSVGTRQISLLKVKLNVSFLIKCPQWFCDTVASLFCVIMKYQQCHFISSWLFKGKRLSNQILAAGTHKRGERTNVILSEDWLSVKQYLESHQGYELSLGLCMLVADSI